MTPRPGAVWVALLGAPVAYETWALQRNVDAALSRVTRRFFRVHTGAGRTMFTAGWAVFAVWFGHHICTLPPVTGGSSEAL